MCVVRVGFDGRVTVTGKSPILLMHKALSRSSLEGKMSLKASLRVAEM